MTTKSIRQMAGSASYFSLAMVGGSDVNALYDTNSVTFIFISRKGLRMEHVTPPYFRLEPLYISFHCRSVFMHTHIGYRRFYSAGFVGLFHLNVALYTNLSRSLHQNKLIP